MTYQCVTCVYSILESECNKFKVKLNKPKNVATFLKALEILRSEKRKSENVLLDEIEHDIESKERFITEQVRTLSDMQTNLNTLIEHKSVLAIAS